MSREALPGYREISLDQVLQADKQAFIAMSDICRAGLGKDGMGVRKAELALREIRSDPLVMTLLNPLPRSSGSGAPKTEARVPSKAELATKAASAARDKARLTTKTDGTVKPKGKGKGNKTKMPKALIGLHAKTDDGDRVCFAYNLSGCSGGSKCEKGKHVCAKCLQSHSLNNCTA
jgi:hypothetical protein